MTNINNYSLLEKHITEISQLNNLINIANWDYATNIPPSSAKNRGSEIATLTSLTHKMFTSDLTQDLITNVADDLPNLDEWQQANLHLLQRSFIRSRCVDPALEEKYTTYSNECEFVWRQAKEQDDFEKLMPYFDKLLAVVKQISIQRAEVLGLSKMDALIDQYQYGAISASIKKTFNYLRKELPPLINQIIDHQKSKVILPITGLITIDQQKLLAKKIMQTMQFDLSAGRLDESIHPFCGGTSNDIRMTTSYDEKDFITGLMGVIHETGHALYEQNLPKAFCYQPVGQAMGQSFHESQALFMEMQVGRSYQFVEFLAKTLKDDFGYTGKEYSADNLYNLINHVSPSFIRIFADEVTYPLHLILRFEIEEEMIEGNLLIKDLPEIWNSKMQEYLGITPPNNAQGCMQDIHWYSGAIGYFPLYNGGAITASMLMKAIKKQHPNVLEEVKLGNFNTLNAYLNQNFRSHGSFYHPNKLLKLSTGEEELNPQTFITYLQNKYL